MPQFNRRELDIRSKEYGFNRDTFEKALRLKLILEYMSSHDYLKEHLLLKGGTAINLTVFNLPRLSVDIDLDFVPNLNREDMMSVREKITDIIKEYMTEQGYILSDASRFSHSLDAFYYNYTNSVRNKDMVKIEINYSLRTHVLPAEYRVFVTEAFGEPLTIKTVAAMEIFASKANALISRAAARDLYDFSNMVESKLFREEEDQFRKCIIFYATISNKEVNRTFDTSAIDGLTFAKIKAELFPVLAVRDKFDLGEKKRQVKEYISSIMKPKEAESEYMDRFMKGSYNPEFLFKEEDILERIRSHPMALWKCKLHQ